MHVPRMGWGFVRRQALVMLDDHAPVPSQERVGEPVYPDTHVPVATVPGVTLGQLALLSPASGGHVSAVCVCDGMVPRCIRQLMPTRY